MAAPARPADRGELERISDFIAFTTFSCLHLLSAAMEARLSRAAIDLQGGTGACMYKTPFNKRATTM